MPDNDMITATPIPNEPGPIPEHHNQWFQQMCLAAGSNQLALMSCLDKETKEPRSVICIVNFVDGEAQFIPLGHLSPLDNPYDAYIPPEQ